MIIRLCIAAVCGYGCSDDYTEIGNRWTEVNTRLIVIDTCTVEVSTAILDSIVTSGGNVIFAGIRESGYWGRTSLSTYLTFKTTDDFEQSSSPEYSREYLFDSLTLFLTPDGSFCGDTVKDMTLAAYRLSEEVELNDDSELYAHSEFGHEETPSGRLAFTPKPLRGRPIEIRLDDAVGEELLDKVTSSDTEVEDDDSFKEWFKGLLVEAEGAAGSILGFSSSDTMSMMKLYYRYRDYAEPVSDTLAFMIDTTYMFTHVESDLGGTGIAGIREDTGAAGGIGHDAMLECILYQGDEEQGSYLCPAVFGDIHAGLDIDIGAETHFHQCYIVQDKVHLLAQRHHILADFIQDISQKPAQIAHRRPGLILVEAYQ